MATYTDPANLFPQPPVSPLLGVSPLSGAMMGMQIPFSQEAGQNTLQSQQIQNMSDLDKLKMQLQSEDPRKMAENSLAEETAKNQNDPALFALQKQAQSQQLIAQAGQSQQVQQQQQMMFAYNLNKQIGEAASQNNGKWYDPTKQADLDWWNTKREQARAVGIPLPVVPDIQADGSSNVQKAMQSVAAPVMANPDLLGKLALGAQQGETERAVGNIRGKYGVEEANIRAQAELGSAGMRSQATVEAANVRSQTNMALVNQITKDLKEGTVPSDGLINLAASQAYMTEAKDTGLGIASLQAYSDGDQKKGNALKQAWMENWKQQMGLDQASLSKLKKGGTSVTPSSAPSSVPTVTPTSSTPSSSLPTVSGPDDYSKVQKGDQYQWVGPDGKVQILTKK